MEDDIPFLQLNQTIISPINISMLKKGLVEKMMEKRITALGLKT
jgi:alanine dehydrogenase